MLLHYAGIAPAFVPAFVIAQAVGGLPPLLAVRALYPDVTPADAADVVLPHAAIDHAANRFVTEGAQ